MCGLAVSRLGDWLNACPLDSGLMCNPRAQSRAVENTRDDGGHFNSALALAHNLDHKVQP